MRRVVAARRRELVAAVAIGTGVSWNVASVGSIADPIAQHYGVSLATVGLFTSALFLAQVLFQVPGGWLIDHWGARRAGFWMLSLVALGNLGSLLDLPIAMALSLRFVVGFAMGTGMIVGISMIVDSQSGAFALGLYGGLALGTGGLAVVLVPSLEQVLGWRSPFVSGVAVATVAAAVFALLADRGVVTRRQRAGLRRLLSNTRLLRFAAVHVSSFGLSIVLSNWVVSLLTRHGHTRAVAGAIGGLILLGGVVGRPGGGLLLGRWPERAKGIVVLSLVAGASGTILLAIGRPTTVAIAGGAVAGLASGVPYAAVVTGAPRLLPEAPAAALAAVVTPSVAAIVLLTPLLGLTFDLPGDGRIGFVAAGILWASSVLLLPTRADLAAAMRP